MRRLLGVSVVLVALAGCGSGVDSHGYPKRARNDFLKACTGPTGGTAKECGCAFDRIEGTMGYKQFQLVDAALSRGDKLAPAQEMPVLKAITSCKAKP